MINDDTTFQISPTSHIPFAQGQFWQIYVCRHVDACPVRLFVYTCMCTALRVTRTKKMFARSLRQRLSTVLMWLLEWNATSNIPKRQFGWTKNQEICSENGQDFCSVAWMLELFSTWGPCSRIWWAQCPWHLCLRGLEGLGNSRRVQTPVVSSSAQTMQTWPFHFASTKEIPREHSFYLFLIFFLQRQKNITR